MSLLIPLGLVAATATTFFVFGIYFQHEDTTNQLDELVQNDPYAFYVRDKIYRALRFCSNNTENASEAAPSNEPTIENPDSHTQQSRLHQIMKYGFPGLDDVRLYSDFVLSYDRRNRVAHWVCEHLTPAALRPNRECHRSRVDYRPDLNVPSNFRSELTDYKRSGYDRGHLAAAGNHHGHHTHCNDTFFLTNIAPQVGKGFNNDAWNNLEIYVRDLTERYGSVYVCTGPLYKPKLQGNGKWSVEFETIGPNMVAVPTHFFKVITVESKLINGKPYMEAYVLPNQSIPDNADLRSFLCDIRDIEHWAGLQFFDGLRRGYFFATNYDRTSQIFRNFN